MLFQAELAFKLYDKDKDGYITKAEMEKLSKNLSKEQIDKVFARFDSDGDGRLSYAEFRKMMTKEKWSDEANERSVPRRFPESDEPGAKKRKFAKRK